MKVERVNLVAVTEGESSGREGVGPGFFDVLEEVGVAGGQVDRRVGVGVRDFGGEEAEGFGDDWSVVVEVMILVSNGGGKGVRERSGVDEAVDLAGAVLELVGFETVEVLEESGDLVFGSGGGEEVREDG